MIEVPAPQGPAPADPAEPAEPGDPVALADLADPGDLFGGMGNGLVSDVRDPQREVAQLRQALATRAPIDQAKGILMLRYRLDADAAFRLLVRWSSLSHVKLRVVAQTLVDLAAGTEPSHNDPMVNELLNAFISDVIAKSLADRTERTVS